MKDIIILRHGETEINRIGGIFQGQTEVPLNAAGEEQAVRTGETLQKKGFRFDRVYSSPLGRAVRSAELVTGMDRKEFIFDDRLLEMSFGAYDGKPWEMMEEQERAVMLFEPARFVARNGVESYDCLLERTADFLRDLKRELTVPEGTAADSGAVLIACHGGTMRGLLIALGLLKLDGFWQYRIGNCAWYHFEFSGGEFELREQDDGAFRK